MVLIRVGVRGRESIWTGWVNCGVCTTKVGHEMTITYFQDKILTLGL